MESFRLVWRDGFAKVLPTKGLERLRDMLLADDQRLTQGSTTTPPPLFCVADWPLEACCPITAASMTEEIEDATVGTAEEAFAKACFGADQLLGEPAACRWMLNWIDDSPRDEVRRELLAEVELALQQRFAEAATTVTAVAPADTAVLQA